MYNIVVIFDLTNNYFYSPCLVYTTIRFWLLQLNKFKRKLQQIQCKQHKLIQTIVFRFVFHSNLLLYMINFFFILLFTYEFFIYIYDDFLFSFRQFLLDFTFFCSDEINSALLTIYLWILFDFHIFANILRKKQNHVNFFKYNGVFYQIESFRRILSEKNSESS